MRASLLRIIAGRALPALLALLVLLSAVPAGAVKTRHLRGVPMQYKSKELRDIIRDVGRAIDRRFIFGDDVRGRVSITVPGRVTPEEAVQLLNAALYLKGFVAVPIADTAYKVIPVETGLPSVSLREIEDEEGEELITTLLPMESVSAQDVVNTLKPYIGEKGIILATEETNSLILVSSEARLRRVMLLASAIDDVGESKLLVRQIRYVDATRLAELVGEVINEGVIQSHQVELFTDQRTNLLIAAGQEERLDDLRDFIDRFDVMNEGSGELRVIPVRNRDPDEVADILREMVKGQNDVSSGVGGRVPNSRARALSNRGLLNTDTVIAVDGATRSLLIQTDQESFEPLLALIGQLDRVPPRVSVDVVAFEFSRPANYVFGIDFTTPLNSPKDEDDLLVLFSSNTSGLLPGVPDPNAALYSRFTRAPIAFPVTEIDGIPIEALGLPTDATSLSLNAGQSDARANLLINPHIVVLSGDEHRVFVGNNVPIPVASGSGSDATDEEAGTPGSAQGPSATVRQNIDRQDVGVELRVKPTVGLEGTVDLEIFFEVSDIATSLAGDPAEVGPTILKRTFEAKIKLRDGEFAVMGAQTDRNLVTSLSGVPFLMDLPFFGHYFRTERRGLRDDDLVVVVSARVLRTREEDIAESIRRQINFDRAIARVHDLDVRSDAPYAVLLDTVRVEDQAHDIARSFAEDGFNTRVTAWSIRGLPVWDVYVTDLPSMAVASELAERFISQGWQAQLMILPTENELAGE